MSEARAGEAEADRLAKIVWEYHHLHQKLRTADCILVFGSADLRVADYGAELFLEGWAPRILFSGGSARLTGRIWKESEAERFAARAAALGVPREKMILETRSANSGENVLFSKKLLEEWGLAGGPLVIVHKPYMERRTYATFKAQWPEADIVVTSPPVPFEEYADVMRSRKGTIAVMVRDLWKMEEYAKKGFQAPQEIPEDVRAAGEKLVSLGYTVEAAELDRRRAVH